MTAAQPPISITVIVDRSGSMQSIKQDVIGGINAFFEEQRQQPGEAVVTLVQFDDKYEVSYSQKPLKLVENLTDATFVPRGMTALHDAIGRTITSIDASGTTDPQIIVIMTDGAENASREYQHAQVKALVDKSQSKGQQIIFLGANIDADRVGGSLGIYANNIATFDASTLGSRSATKAVGSKLSSMRSSYTSGDANWGSAGASMASLYKNEINDIANQTANPNKKTDKK